MAISTQAAALVALSIDLDFDIGDFYCCNSALMLNSCVPAVGCALVNERVIYLWEYWEGLYWDCAIFRAFSNNTF